MPSKPRSPVPTPVLLAKQAASLDMTIGVTLPGVRIKTSPTDFSPIDQVQLMRFNGTTYTLEFDAAANGIPNGVITDAVSEIGPGNLLLSFDVTVAVGGITADDEDLVRFKSGVVSLFFNGSVAGIDPGLDLDAAHILSSNGHLLLALDGRGTVGALLKDPSVYEDLKLILGNVKRNKALRWLVRYTIEKDGLDLTPKVQ